MLLADAGYWRKEQMENVINHGIQVLIPPDAGKRTGIRPGWPGGAYARMRRVLSTELGRALDRKRLITATHNLLKLHSHQISTAGA